jgi:hypothetical protein
MSRVRPGPSAPSAHRCAASSSPESFGARILSLGDGNAPGYLQLANIWMILNVGGGPTPDKPTVTLSVPDPNHINSFMNFRVADIQACYELWKSRGAKFITEPIPKYGETRDGGRLTIATPGEKSPSHPQPNWWRKGLFSTGSAGVPPTLLLQRYAQVFGERKRVSEYLSSETG